MGNFYVNQTVKCADPERIAAFLSDYQAFLSPAQNGTVVVYERRCDLQDVTWIRAFSDSLSTVAGGPVLSVLNHDDDILFYSLHRDGSTIDVYDSAPDYFDETASEDSGPSGGDAALLCGAFGSDNVAAVRKNLHAPQTGREYLFAIERHQALADALGIASYGVGFGWQYLHRGECPKGLARANLLELKGDAAYKGFTFPY